MYTNFRYFPQIADHQSLYPTGFPDGTSGKELVCQRRRHKRCGQEDPLEEGMAIYSSILAWRIPWTEKLGGQRVGHD